MYIGTQTDDVDTAEVWSDHLDISCFEPERHRQISRLIDLSKKHSSELKEYALKGKDVEIGLITPDLISP